MKIWTYRSALWSGSQNAWTQIKNVNSAICLSNFWNFFGVIQMISCRDWWPWMKPCYITMTQRWSNNLWSGGIVAHPAPKNSECKNPLENFLPQFFFGSRRHPPHWLSSKGPNYQRGVLLISADAIEGHFEGKTPWGGKVTKVVLFFHNNAPAHQALAIQKKLARLGFQCLDHPPYSPDLAPSDYHLFPGLKKQLKGRHFLSDAEVFVATETWLDRQPSEFFEWIAKVRATGQEVYWASWGVCWINPKFGRCSLYPSSSG